MKVLITGAAGFIGSRLILRMAERHTVFALARHLLPAVKFSGVVAIGADLALPLNRSLLPAAVDVIIHLAQANSSFPEAASELFAVSTGITQELLDYGRLAGAKRFVLASSGYVYGRRKGFCIETDVALPTSHYAVTKYSAELLALSYADYLTPCVFRIFWPYGPGQSNRLIPKLADRIRQGQPIRLHQGGQMRVTPIYIDDVVAAFERATETTYAGVFNLAGDTAVSLRSLANEVGQTLGMPPQFEEGGDDSGDMMGDNSLMKEIFELFPTFSLSAGLARTFKEGECLKC